MGTHSTEEGRIEAAEAAGRNVARHEALSGQTEPRNWDKDGVHNAGAFSHLAAAGTRLEYLRGEIEAERVSTAELIELQGYADHIDRGDVLLLQWAGVPEFPED